MHFGEKFQVTKNALHKILSKIVIVENSVAIVQTKLQRFESRINVKKTLCAAPEISSPKRTPDARMGRTHVTFGVRVQFYPSILRNFPYSPIFSSHILKGRDLRHIMRFFFTFPLLSKRCNFVKMIATKLFIDFDPYPPVLSTSAAFAETD